MRFLGKIICICVVFVLVASAARAFLGNSVPVKKVYDGDTMLVRGGQVVRLQGVDTPEIGKRGKPDQYYARNARSILQQIVRGKRVTLAMGKKSKDHYGRVVAEVHLLQKKESVNEMLVRKGAAFYYYHRDVPVPLARKLLQAQVEAMENNAGFWPRIKKLGDKNGAVPCNKRSKRCFPKNCNDAKTIKKRNRIELESMTEAFKRGYSPARQCGFWPNVKKRSAKMK